MRLIRSDFETHQIIGKKEREFNKEPKASVFPFFKWSGGERLVFSQCQTNSRFAFEFLQPNNFPLSYIYDTMKIKNFNNDTARVQKFKCTFKIILDPLRIFGFSQFSTNVTEMIIPVSEMYLQRGFPKRSHGTDTGCPKLERQWNLKVFKVLV